MTGRDLVGYAGSPPLGCWPSRARVAISFVLNYEEGAERTPLLGDSETETLNSEVLPHAPLTGRRNLSMESFYEYGSRVGFWRILDLFERRSVAYSVNAVGFALTLNPRVCEALRDLKPDIIAHGWRWTDCGGLDEGTERDQIDRTVTTIEALTGVRPVGWYTGRPSENTRRLLVERGDILYDSDAFNDDLPYWTTVSGRGHLVVPYANDTNDNRLARGEGMETAGEYFAYLRDSFDWLYRNAERNPGMMSIGLHARIIGRPGRMSALEAFLDHVCRHDAVWIAARRDIALHWKRSHPAPS